MSRKYALYLLLVLLMAVSSCSSDKEKEEALKWRITLDPRDKIPYGAYLASESIKYYFPEASLEPMPTGFHYDKMDRKMKQNDSGTSMIIFAGLDFKVSEEEWGQFKDFVKSGNEIVIFCSTLDEKIENELSCFKERGDEERNNYGLIPPDLHNQNVLRISGQTGKSYGYTGRSLKGYFSIKIDSTDVEPGEPDQKNETNDDQFYYLPDTLGYANELPDIVRYKYGKGHFTLHAAPLVLSNYFLLQPGNIDYLTAIWQTLPTDINRIYTHAYFKRNGEASGFDVLMKFPATKWALLLGIFALLMYILFESKRKQRIIPVVAPLKNDSVSFVETIGRLYYNKGNHANLAAKMIQQFLEWVRMRHFLNTNLLNEQFIQQLTIRSGQPETTVRQLMEMVHEIKLGDAKIDDAYLYQLYTTIQQFYNYNRK